DYLVDDKSFTLSHLQIIINRITFLTYFLLLMQLLSKTLAKNLIERVFIRTKTNNLTSPSINKSIRKMHSKVVIIGSGPAGHTAALYLSRATLEPVMYEGFLANGIAA